MSPEHMAKIREARMAKLEAERAAGLRPAKKEKPPVSDVPKKRGRTAEEMAKLREMRGKKKDN